MKIASRLPVLLCGVLLSALILSPGFAQDTSVNPPAFLTTDNSANWEPGQLLFREIGFGRQTVAIYHNGVLYTGGFTDNPWQQFEWSDFSDVESLQFTATRQRQELQVAGAHVSHGHGGKLEDWVLAGLRRTSTLGVNIVETFPGTLPFQATRPFPENAERFHESCWPWRLSFTWPQYQAETGWGWGYRHELSLGEWDSTAETGIIGQTLMFGNLLFLISDETQTGVAVYDMAPMFEDPPQPPQLLDKLSGNLGGYFNAVWRNYLVLPSDGTLTLIDFSDPTNLTVAGTVVLDDPIPGQDYVQFQDEFAFYNSAKINLDTLTVELVFDAYDTGNRPAGSVSGWLNTSQYMMPFGNFVATCGRGSSGEDGTGVWVHQDEPDTRRPEIGYHVPRPNQTNYPTGAAITLALHETIESWTLHNGVTVIVREATPGSLPVDCWVSFSHNDLITITPHEFLAEDTEYVVEIVDGGIKDVAGNGIIGHTFNFSTGNSAPGGNLPPVIDSLTTAPAIADPGTPVTVSVAAHDPEGTATLEYRFSAGDGSSITPWQAGSTSFSHNYASAGHYDAKVEVREQGNPSFRSLQVTRITAANAIPPGPRPTNSSPIAQDEIAGKIWVVNPDQNTVTRLDVATQVVDFEVPVSAHPSNLAIDSTGRAWVTCRDADTIAIVAADGSTVDEIALNYGEAPFGIAPSPDRASMFVTTTARAPGDGANGQLLRFSTATQLQTGSLELGPTPRAIAIFGAGDRVLVTRFITGHPRGGEIWDVDASSSSQLTLNGTIFLTTETTEDSASNGTGLPNYIAGITISPDEQTAWYGATKPSSGRGELFGELLETDNSVRAMIGRIDLSGATPSDPDQSRIDIDNADSPSSILFSSLGDWALVSAQGNNSVGVYDRIAVDENASPNARSTQVRLPVGLAPQGMVLDPATNQLWVKNFMGRSVTVLDLSPFFGGVSTGFNPLEIVTVSAEQLPENVLNGKQIFYNASDNGGPGGLNRMSVEGYISCATCHVDGGHDGVVWDFTQRGEGLRNTIDLRGRSGMAHGRVHWTANFDELQDFEHDIRGGFGGHGFLTDAEFAATSPPLGAPKAGLDSDLDDLAAYMTSLSRDALPRSPYRATDGSLTPDALAGAAIFARENCASCHTPDRDFTHSGLAGLQDVGSTRPSSGAPNGIDTPTLLGLWDGAPFLHNGRAATLGDVFRAAGGSEHQAEDATLTGSTSIRNVSQSNGNSGAQGGSSVWMTNGSGSIEWANLDGGAGGPARIELAYTTTDAHEIEVEINGVAQNRQLLKTQDSGLDGVRWQMLVLETPLDPGPNNTVRVTDSTNFRTWFDHLHIATADDFTSANVHTRVASLPAADQANLLSFLRQLDGSTDAAEVVPSETDSYEEWATAIDWPAAADASPDGDPDQDGRSNFEEYARGSDPLVSDSLLDNLFADIEWVGLDYRRNARAEVAFMVQISTDLIVWTDTPADGTDLIHEVTNPDPNGDGLSEDVRARLRFLPGEPRKFLRLIFRP
ncbi:MAG: DNA-binding beta-propeller fold protein YncE [Verrucomicrobiales bacterium]|jgi:DNA-binding beta-propeller fold protein YncE